MYHSRVVADLIWYASQRNHGRGTTRVSLRMKQCDVLCVTTVARSEEQSFDILGGPAAEGTGICQQCTTIIVGFLDPVMSQGK